MKYKIKDFKHISGKNCVTTALRNILSYYRITLSEELIMGLAGGLGFYYKEQKGFPNPFIGGNSSGMIYRFCQNMNLKLIELRKTNPESAHKAMLGKILSNIPSIVQVDLYYLEYFQSKYHFSGHRVIPVAVDDEYVYIADTGYRSLKRTSIESFKKARNSDYPPRGPGNLLLYISPPEGRELPILENIWSIIKDNALRILNSKSGNGVDALEKFVLNSEKFADLDYLYIQIEKAGTGGALGRLMYRDFLSEANLYRPHKVLVEAYEYYSEIVTRYELIVKEIKKGRNEDISNLLQEIYVYEKMASEILTELPD